MCCCLVAKSCPAFCSLMDCNPPGFSIHGVSQARTLEWVAQGSNPRLLQWQADFLRLSHQGSPIGKNHPAAAFGFMYFTGCSFVTIGNYFTSLGLGFLINKNGSNDAPPRRVVVRRRGKGMYSTYLRQTLIDASFLPPSLCYSTQLTWTQRQITNTRSIWKH